jgi:hypothetical protein
MRRRGRGIHRIPRAALTAAAARTICAAPAAMGCFIASPLSRHAGGSNSSVMPGHSPSKTGVNALIAGHPRLTFFAASKSWMAGTSPAMTDTWVKPDRNGSDVRSPHPEVLACLGEPRRATQVGCCRLAHLIMPNSGKPEISGGQRDACGHPSRRRLRRLLRMRGDAARRIDPVPRRHSNSKDDTFIKFL